MASSSPIRVLQLISSSDFLGAERVVAEIARQSNPASVDMTVGVIAAVPDVPRRMELEVGRGDVPVVQLPGGRRFDGACLREIGALVERYSIQIVHSHNYKSDFYALAARYLKRQAVRLLASSHNWILSAPSEHFYKFLDLKMLRAFDGVVAISERIRDEIVAAGIRPSRVRVIDNGIDLASLGVLSRSEARSLLGRQEQDWVVGCVGSLTPEKGHLDLLTAVLGAMPHIPDLWLILAGDGPLRPAIEEFIARNGIAARVQLLGSRADVRSLYPAFDVLALASHDEGLPMVVLEAMGSGVPVVATPVGAVPRVIESGKNGILTAPRSPDAMRDTLVSLSRDESRRRTLAENGQATVRGSFSSIQMAAKYEDLYRSLVGRQFEGGR